MYIKRYLFLDDERYPDSVTWIDLDKSVKWEIVRSFEEAVQWVEKHGIPNVISFDHDLGEHFHEEIVNDELIIGPITAKTGYDFANWLIDYDMDTNCWPSDFSFTVHSKNPIGAENIKSLINNYLKQK